LGYLPNLRFVSTGRVKESPIIRLISPPLVMVSIKFGVGSTYLPRFHAWESPEKPDNDGQTLQVDFGDWWKSENIYKDIPAPTNKIEVGLWPSASGWRKSYRAPD
jgi:hypothetical protein